MKERKETSMGWMGGCNEKARTKEKENNFQSNRIKNHSQKKKSIPKKEQRNDFHVQIDGEWKTENDDESPHGMIPRRSHQERNLPIPKLSHCSEVLLVTWSQGRRRKKRNDWMHG